MQFGDLEVIRDGPSIGSRCGGSSYLKVDKTHSVMWFDFEEERW